jgi:hypothetical protein
MKKSFNPKIRIMKTNSYELLVNATGTLMQQHAFDHLSDEKLSRMQSYLHRLSKQSGTASMDREKKELFKLFDEADLYNESTTPQSLHQWQAAMSCFGKTATQGLLLEVVEG